MGSLALLIGSAASIDRWRDNNPDADHRWLTSVDELHRVRDAVSSADHVALVMLPGAQQYYPADEIKAALDELLGQLPVAEIDYPEYADEQLIDLAGWLIRVAQSEPLDRVKLLGAGRANTIRAELSDARNRAARIVWDEHQQPPTRSMGGVFGVSPSMAARLIAGGRAEGDVDDADAPDNSVGATQGAAEESEAAAS